MDKEVRELEKALEQTWDIATTRFGLDPFPTRFEVVPATVMYEVGSYALPGRYSHWSFGKAYHKMKTMYDFGLSKIYEVVINSNPAYAFLLENNSLLQNKLVIAHVLGHVDFFKHNAYFAHTNRQMVEGASVNADRIRHYEYQHGTREVEQFLDAVLSIQEHVEPTPPAKPPGKRESARRAVKTTAYDDLFYLGADRLPEVVEEPRKVPAEPERDLLLFIAEHARSLEDWQRDIIH